MSKKYYRLDVGVIYGTDGIAIPTNTEGHYAPRDESDQVILDGLNKQGRVEAVGEEEEKGEKPSGTLEPTVSLAERLAAANAEREAAEAGLGN